MSPFSSDSELFALLSKHDAIALLELINESLACATKECLAELMENIKMKLNAASRAHAIAIALELGLITF